ncbi:MAG: transcription-repair coupling factor [Methylococcales bacterium]|jgi:transcription-repair coupling factor (superfamily II helicase)
MPIDNPLFKTALPASPTTPMAWEGLLGCADSLAIALTIQQNNQFLVVVTQDNHTALRLEHEIAFFLQDNDCILHFPDWETLAYDVFSPLPEIISQRLKTLTRLSGVKRGVLIVSVATLMQRLAPRQHILANSFEIRVGGLFKLTEQRARLDSVGYQYVNQVLQHAEFSIRGSIIDLFPMGSALPYRIELFDDEVESIRTFDPETQRSLEKVQAINLFPAREFPVTDDSVKQFRKNFREKFPSASSNNPIYSDVSQGIMPGGIEYYLPLFVDSTDTLFDYLPAETVFLKGRGIQAQALAVYEEIQLRYEQRKYDLERPLLAPNSLFIETAELEQRMASFRQVFIGGGNNLTKESINYSCLELPDVAINERLKEPAFALKQFVKGVAGKILFVAETPGHREALIEQLKKYQISVVVVGSWAEFLRSNESQCILVAPIDHGLNLASSSLAIITESQLLGSKVQQRRRRKKSSARELENVVSNLNELSLGSPVVHQDHGVGRYLGLQILELNGIAAEFLALEYAGNDKIYVPVSSLHLIGRYTGMNVDSAPLHKLGGEQWRKAKKKAIVKVRDVATELLDIQVKRSLNKGFSFVCQLEDYHAFSAAFPFEETPDQLTTIESILEDMAKSQPMDRVVCGDVGFGKTEVAMRAAFIAVQNSKQVAVLVPTTLLAQQHFQNFRDRMTDWPIRVEVISRFLTAKKQKLIIDDIATGAVDIIIGTHKLFSKEINYKNLGLVIIDEEHRFGVRQKEHFKKIRHELDLLALTATPIPRTLNMAMSGLREVSIIATPPSNRHSIKTFISEWVDSMVQEACLREIKRGGQVYFLHNEVKTMERQARELQRLLPEARIEIAHGQMPERELEQVMLDFYHQKFNILICTTIIESGIDLPTANTIIINRADKLGLAQLHQLRGRVGRSHHRAYAYLLVPPKKLMTKDAVKRLEAIETAGELGAGFMLASHDLEIRGAGELLGDGQSGQIQEIGFTLYTELLERTITALKSGEHPELERPMDTGPEVDLQCSALIPEDYLPDIHSRLVLYKRIANASDSVDLRELQIEMIDRFGLLPDAVKNLFEITQLKQQAGALGVKKIEVNASGGRLVFTATPNVDAGKLIALVQTKPDIYRLEGADKLRFSRRFKTTQNKIEAMTALLTDISL